MKVYSENDLGIEIKQDSSPLTRADLAAHHVIADALETTGLPILSEEGKDIPYSVRRNWDQFWLVDPLDGTKEFIKRNGEFTVNIALIRNTQPVFGVIYAPEPDIMYFGGREYPSRRMSQLNKETRINDQTIEQLSDVLPIYHRDSQTYKIVASRSHRNEATEAFISKISSAQEVEFVPKGSSLKFCLVAEGSADCYPRFAPTMEWDSGAGHAIAIGANIKVTQEDGSDLVYNKQYSLNPHFIVSQRL